MKNFKRKICIIIAMAMVLSTLYVVPAFGVEKEESDSSQNASAGNEYELVPVADGSSVSAGDNQQLGTTEANGLFYDEDFEDYYYYVRENSDSSWESPKVGDYRMVVYDDDSNYELSGNAIGGKTVYKGSMRIYDLEKYTYDGEFYCWDWMDEDEVKSLDFTYKWENSAGETVSENETLTIDKVAAGANETYTMTVYMNDFDGNPQIIMKTQYICKPKKACIVMYMVPNTPSSFYTLPGSIKVKKGKKIKIRAWVRTGDKLKSYKSSNKKVATISSKGVLVAKKQGKAKITVYSVLGAKDTVTVKVTRSTIRTKAIKAKSSQTIYRGDYWELPYSISPVTSTQKVKFKSSNSKIVSVTKKGVIKGKKRGTCTITIKSGSKSKKVKVKVIK